MNVLPRLLRGRRSTTAAFFTTLLLCTALPTVCDRAGLDVPGREAVARADEASDKNNPVTTLARKRYTEGVKAYDAHHYDAARQAFAQAYELKHHAAVLLNLGQSELQSGHAEDAGNHLNQFLRQHEKATDEERSAAEQALTEVRKKTSSVTVTVDAAGADVSMDGTTLGKAPLTDPVFVKAGKHTVYASLDGRSNTATVDAKVGASSTVSLVIGAPAPTPAVATAAAGGSGSESATGATTAGAASSEASAGGRTSYGSWFVHRPLAWAGTSLAGAGLVVGILFGSYAQTASAASATHIQQIRAENKAHPQFNPTNSTYLCGDAAGKGAVPHYATACAMVAKDARDYQTDVALTATGWSIFAVAVIGTVAYTYAGWAAEKGPSVSLLPVISPSEHGVAITGTF